MDIVINAAVLGAVVVAANSVMIAENAVPNLFYAKGNYFGATLKLKSPRPQLIPPLPNDEELGLHLTFDRKGRVKLWPDVEWIDTL